MNLGHVLISGYVFWSIYAQKDGTRLMQDPGEIRGTRGGPYPGSRHRVTRSLRSGVLCMEVFTQRRGARGYSYGDLEVSIPLCH